MKPGQRIQFDPRDIEEAFGPERLPFFIHGRGSVDDRIMSAPIGSQHGEWIVRQDVLMRKWMIDRRDYYDKLEDGTYVRNAAPYQRRG